VNIHSSARNAPYSRALLAERIESGWSVEEASDAAGISERTGYKWLARYRESGRDGVNDRSSRPKRSPTALRPELVKLIEQLRRQSRMTAKQIGTSLKIPRQTVARVLVRLGISRLKYLAPPEPIVRYEHKKPGSLLHLDTKKLGKIGGVGHRINNDRTTRTRGIGWEFVHVAIDDCTRLAYAEVLPSETAVVTAQFLLRAIAWFAKRGIRIRRVMTDNAFQYVNSNAFAAICSSFRIKHVRTRPYRPQTNGKAERFIQTLLREWAYFSPYTSSEERTARLRVFLRYYNGRRSHGGLNGLTPLARFARAA
jgi:transposase InsO family protein